MTDAGVHTRRKTLAIIIAATAIAVVGLVAAYLLLCPILPIPAGTIMRMENKAISSIFPAHPGEH